MAEVKSEPIRGATSITASLGKDGALTLKVGEQSPVTGKAPRTIPQQPKEDFCLGHDNGQPVVTYGKLKPFTGKITELKITTP